MYLNSYPSLVLRSDPYEFDDVTVELIDMFWLRGECPRIMSEFSYTCKFGGDESDDEAPLLTFLPDVTQDRFHFDTVVGDVRYSLSFHYNFLMVLENLINGHIERNYNTVSPSCARYAAAA